jgi:endonuclease/exonuclease/phosphatase family metal-dependent hydrolase
LLVLGNSRWSAPRHDGMRRAPHVPSAPYPTFPPRQYRGLHVYNTHWDHLSAAARTESARLLLGRLPRAGAGAGADADDPVVLVGDLNAPVGEDSVRALLAGGLTDVLTHTTPAEGDRATYHAWSGSDAGPYNHIDYVMVRGG